MYLCNKNFSHDVLNHIFRLGHPSSLSLRLVYLVVEYLLCVYQQLGEGMEADEVVIL